jgi:hypothetical protein
MTLTATFLVPSFLLGEELLGVAGGRAAVITIGILTLVLYATYKWRVRRLDGNR